MVTDIKYKSVADLKPGERGVISGFTDSHLSLKLLEMGCLPGTEVRMNYAAPLGDPICIKVAGYNLSLRIDEAQIIILES
ncbi:ferrous iron transport protein A [Roseivirga sp. BDSF3-8]|uniref:FeoA family protein n=1 Tax=Roseivirga sp. BDSF3-8 TaxID=3241598 RepID=UPI00353264F3